MRIRATMGNKSSPELTLSFLLMAALGLEAFIIESIISITSEKMSWTEARLYCQQNHVDLIVWRLMHGIQVPEWLLKSDIEQIWIGLLRDPEDDKVWKWINLRTGEGISGLDFSQSSNWATGQPTGHCAAVADNLTWYSDRCSSAHYFSCSEGDIIHHYQLLRKWRVAAEYCREQGNMSRLATINENNKNNLHSTGWIGLYRTAGETWSWIGDFSSNYRNWAPGQPVTADCASFNPDSLLWYSNACSTKLHAACYDDNLVVVNQEKTWEDALWHCQGMATTCEDPRGPCIYSHTLLSLDSLSNYYYVRDRIYRATTDEVWIGLRFLGGHWWWVDGGKVEDQGMLPACPSQETHCGTLSKYDTNKWIVRDCTEKRSFICIRHRLQLVVTDNKTESEEG